MEVLLKVNLHQLLWYLLTHCLLLHQLLSTIKTPNPQSPGPSASLAETEEISKAIESDPDSLHGHSKCNPPLISC
jgi:hypothetical protein